MLPQLLALGAIPVRARLALWLLPKLAQHLKPLLGDPGAALRRIGDVLVWDGQGGRKVLATLESLSEGQARIETAVRGIEATQLSLVSGLGALTSLSLLHVGLTSLAAGLMLHRVRALEKRLEDLGDQLGDIQAQLTAQQKAALLSGINSLTLYEGSRRQTDLDHARQSANFAAHLYGDLVRRECGGRRRLPALNYCGRCYLLALLTEARCLVLSDDLAHAEQRLADEQPALALFARTTFTEVLGKSPEVYLHPCLQAEGVTLDVLAGVYQQAHGLSAVDGTPVNDAGELFERLRKQLYGADTLFGLGGKAKEQALLRLKYLIACLEEVGRVEAVRLRIATARAGGYSLAELEGEIAGLLRREPVGERDSSPWVVAYPEG